MDAADVSSAQIAAHMPLIRREACTAIKKLPASIELDQLIQAGRLAAWEAIAKFDGRGSLEGYIVAVIRQRFIDFQRATHPAGRSGKKIVFESLDDEGENFSEDFSERADPTADAVLDKLTYEHALAGMDPRRRSVVERVIAGEQKDAIASSMGVSPSRVSQLLKEATESKKRNRTPDTFDPASVPLRMNVQVPPVDRKLRNRYRELLDRMPAGSSCVLGKTQAASLLCEMKRQKVRAVFRSQSATTVEVWREPTAEQCAEARKVVHGTRTKATPQKQQRPGARPDRVSGRCPEPD